MGLIRKDDDEGVVEEVVKGRLGKGFKNLDTESTESLGLTKTIDSISSSMARVLNENDIQYGVDKVEFEDVPPALQFMSAKVYENRELLGKASFSASIGTSEGISLDGSVGYAVGGNFTINNPNPHNSFSYQYVHFFSISDNDDNWAVPHANGWVAYSNKWNTDVGSNTTTIGDTVTLSRSVAMSGFIVPHDNAILVGFYAMVRNNDGDNQAHVGLFHNTYANVGAKTGTSDTWALRAYAAGDKTGGDGNSYHGPCETQDMTRSLALSAGDMIVPAVMEETANKIYYNITVVIKTPIF